MSIIHLNRLQGVAVVGLPFIRRSVAPVDEKTVNSVNSRIALHKTAGAHERCVAPAVLRVSQGNLAVMGFPHRWDATNTWTKAAALPCM